MIKTQKSHHKKPPHHKQPTSLRGTKQTQKPITKPTSLRGTKQTQKPLPKDRFVPRDDNKGWK